MPSLRQRRVADQLREVISEVIRNELQDGRLNGVTIMDVTIDRELEVANVFISCIHGEGARPAVEAALAGATGLVRREVGRRIKLRHTPELRFHWDELLDEAEKINSLIDSLNAGGMNHNSEGTDEHH